MTIALSLRGPTGGSGRGNLRCVSAMGRLIRSLRLLAMTGLGVLAFGCGAQTGTDGWASLDTPRHGGVLRIATDSDPGGYDVQKVTDVTALILLMPVHAQIIRQVPNVWTELEGDLATRWEPSTDGSTWTFTFRDDAKWHDGKPVTVDDVQYSLQRQINPPPGYKGGNAGCLKEVVTNTAKIDESKLKVELNAPAVAFLQCIGMAYIRMAPKHILEPIDFREQSRELKPNEVIGAGPFKFKSYERGSTWVMERNPDYYLKEKPYLDGITYYVIPDLNTAVASLKAGQLDSSRSFAVKPSQVTQLNNELGNKLVIHKADNARLQGLFFNTQSGPFQDIRLRKAVHLALNRQAMIEFVQENDGFITPPLCSCWEYIYDQKYYTTRPGFRAEKSQDLREAKRLVDEVTGGRGLDVTITSTNTPATIDYVQLEQSQLAEVGIRVKLDIGESAIVQQRYRDGQFQAATHPGAVPFLDPDSMIARYFTPKGDRNWARWNNREFNDLYAKESVERNLQERGKLLRRMADILEDELPVTGLTDAYRYVPMTSNVRGFDKAPPSVNADLRYDWVWLTR